uniref:Uncharacterized protein n=1 Tax=Sinocyclocheilus rhinocerous TaxID=307959 RepID=A0A673KYB9_9TELE
YLLATVGVLHSLAFYIFILFYFQILTLCVLAVMTRFLYQHRQAQRTARLQEKEHQHSLEAAYRAEFHLHNSMRDSMQEYYI